MTLGFAPENIELRPLERLPPYAQNAKMHGPNQVARIAASITEFIATNPDPQRLRIYGFVVFLASMDPSFRRSGSPANPALQHCFSARQSESCASVRLARNGRILDKLAIGEHA